MSTIDPAEIAAFIRYCPRDKSRSLEILQDIQRRYGYIPREVFAPLAGVLGVKAASLYTLATFYKALSVTPKGKHIIKICDGTACHIRGAVSLAGTLERTLGIPVGKTTLDGLFTVETVNCLGACALAPAMVVDETYYPKTTPEKIREILEQYRISGSRSGGGYG